VMKRLAFMLKQNLRGAAVPVPEGILGWEPIKSVVHLDCVEYASVQGEPLRRRTLLQVPILMCAAIPHLRREELRDPERVVRARPLLRRRRAAERACRANAGWEAPLRPSLFSARVIARERLLEERRVVR
jgi:hypothetical protein